MNDEIKVNKANKSLTFINNEIAFSQFGIADEILDLITNLQEEKNKYKMRCYKAYKMIFDNYGVLDKYGIEMLEDILEGKEDE